MFGFNSQSRFLVYHQPVDMRKGFLSLCMIVNNEMGRKLSDGDTFIFINKRLNRIKLLRKETIGLVLYYVRLDSSTISLVDSNDNNEFVSRISWAKLLESIEKTRAKQEYQKQRILMKDYL